MTEFGSEHRPTTTQLTSKRIKGILLVGYVVVVIGFGMAIAAITADDEVIFGWAGMAVAGLGVIAVVCAKFVQWWKHG